MTIQTKNRGRPKDQTKKLALLRAARELFLEQGLEVTTDEICLKAGVAKATLYSNFSDKETLLEAVIRKESELTVRDEDLLRGRETHIENALTEFGIRYVNFINQRELLGWDRLIAAASRLHPELPKRFFDAGPGRAQQVLISIIQEAIQRGELQPCDAQIAADDLTGLWLGFNHLEIKLGVKSPLTVEEVAQRVVHGLAIFMSFYRS